MLQLLELGAEIQMKQLKMGYIHSLYALKNLKKLMNMNLMKQQLLQQEMVLV